MCLGRAFGFLDFANDVEDLIVSVVNTFEYFAIVKVSNITHCSSLTPAFRVGQIPWLDYILRKNFVSTQLFGASSPFAIRTLEMLQERLIELKHPRDETSTRDITSGLSEARESGAE